MTKTLIRRLLAQTFLTIAYLFVTFQWLWVLVLGLPPMIETGVFDSLSPTPQTEQTTPTVTAGPSPVLLIVAGVITLVFLAITIIVLVKLPKTISRTGDKIVHQATEAIIPILTHRQNIPAKKKRALSSWITTTIQSAMVLIPLIASLFLPPIGSVTSQVIFILALWLAIVSSICFILSWLLRPATTSRTRSRASRG